MKGLGFSMKTIVVPRSGCKSFTLIVRAPVQEPPKAAMLEYEASGRQGPKPARQAACIVQLPAEPGAAVAEALVDLSSPTPTIISWDRVRPFLSVQAASHLWHVP